MRIFKYKILQSGLVFIIMLENLMINLQVYIKNVRLYFVKEDEEYIFVIKEGVVFNSGIFGRRIKSWWLKVIG